ncbi:MAG: DsbA family oxidoreductase [Halobacteria archaeon]|nr:DsbA family oxidoreductase [Halobacteria archaeon]
MTEVQEDKLVVYSDYVCPFCYLGKASMEEYLKETDKDIDVEWRVFDLRGYKRNPDGSIDDSVEDGKDDAYFEQVRENVKKLKDRYGVEMTLDFSVDVDSWNAQKASIYVKREHRDKFDDFHEAVFDALWEGGRDIGDVDVLAEIGDSVGLDPDEIRSAVGDEELEDELKSRFEQAQQKGIRGVPAFIYDQHVATGAIPPHQFERLVEGT